MLIQAEQRLYRGESGCHGFTSVMDRESSGHLVALWDTAAMAADNEGMELPQPVLDATIQRKAAWRVAQAMALVNFGAEFLLK